MRADVIATVGGLLRDGTLPRWAWPGGYPIGYVTGDGDTLCAACGAYWAEDVTAATIFEGSCVDHGGPQWCDGQTECDGLHGEVARFVKCECGPDGEPGEWCDSFRQAAESGPEAAKGGADTA